MRRFGPAPSASRPAETARAPKIGIAHGAIVSRDAIGHDILGMQQVLTDSGFETCLIADHFGTDLPPELESLSVGDAIARRDFDLLIYHHSILWENGETLLRALPVRRLLKYHNVTPPEFFTDYSRRYADLCRAGRAQTVRLVQLFGPQDRFAAASAYNAAELAAAGARDVFVVPPFTGMKVAASRRPTLPTAPYRALFVGRLVPNKGHLGLLNTIAAYVASQGPAIRLQIVGAADAEFDAYRRDLEEQIDRLDIRPQVVLSGGVDREALERLYTEASVYLCLSEHEGFCVPIIEAQAVGLPVVSVDTAALGETIGPGQLVVPAPTSRVDYLHIARLVQAVCTEPELRQAAIRAGYRNLLTRFTPAIVADRFMDAVVPLLGPRS